MTWKLQDDQMRDMIKVSVAPPTNVNDLFEDHAWATVFEEWAVDYGSAKGDQTPRHLRELWKDVRYGTPWRDIHDKYVVSGNPCGLDWPGIVTDRFDKLDAGQDDSTGTLTELMDTADLEIDRYLRTFLADILEIQTTGASDAESEVLTRLRIDMAAVDSVNEVTQKNLQEGDDVDFLILGDLLLIGYNHDKAYVEYAKAQGAERGKLVMTEKGDGTMFHRGEVTVKISSGNFDNVKAGIKRFSKKKVTAG